jgi:hypothetical protein
LAVGLGIKAKDFLIVRRPKLAKITKHPAIGFANYERRLNSGQSVLQSIKQVYLGARERAVVGVAVAITLYWKIRPPIVDAERPGCFQH